MQISANLGFLFLEHKLPEAIANAARCGFDGVECQFPFDTSAMETRASLDSTGIPMLSINTLAGNAAKDEFGLSALKSRESDARAEIIKAVSYAQATGARFVHVLAGRGINSTDAKTFVRNLRFAADIAGKSGIGILIEPINTRDVPEYFLTTVEQAVSIIDQVGADNLRIMFDCYHVQIMQGDILSRFRANLEYIGHVQFASVPGRNEPDRGEVNFSWLLNQFYDAGYDGYVGAEYRPQGKTEAGLGWMDQLKQK